MTRPPVQLHSRVVLNPSDSNRVAWLTWGRLLAKLRFRPSSGFLLDTPVGRLPNAPGRAYSTRSRMRGPNRNG